MSFSSQMKQTRSLIFVCEEDVDALASKRDLGLCALNLLEEFAHEVLMLESANPGTTACSAEPRAASGPECEAVCFVAATCSCGDPFFGDEPEHEEFLLREARALAVQVALGREHDVVLADVLQSVASVVLSAIVWCGIPAAGVAAVLARPGAAPSFVPLLTSTQR